MHKKVAKINIAHKCCNASLKVNNNNNNLLYIICQATPDHNVLQILPPFLPPFSALLPHSPRKDFPVPPFCHLCFAVFYTRGEEYQTSAKPGLGGSWVSPKTSGSGFVPVLPPNKIISGSRSSSSKQQIPVLATSVFFIKLISKFWRNLTKKLAKN